MTNRNRRLLGTLLFFLLFLALIAAGTANPADSPRKCARCGEWITGEYIMAGGEAFHPWCFYCDVCGDPINGGYIEHEGKFYHESCYLERFAPRCDYCGKPITGKYVSREGKVYHDSCYSEHVAARCVYCGKPIRGRFVENDWSQRVHAACSDLVRICDSCGRFIPPGEGRLLPDGRVQCAHCRRTAVVSPVRARRVVARAETILAKKGIRLKTPLEEINIELIDRNRLESMAGGGGDPHGMHYVRTESRNGKIVHEETTIYLLKDLPEELMLAVAGHELFHVWQHEHGADGGDPAWREGSANVAMYLVLQTLDSDFAAHQRRMLMTTEDPVYGGGFRYALKYYEQNGVTDFLDTVIVEVSGPRRE